MKNQKKSGNKTLLEFDKCKSVRAGTFLLPKICLNPLIIFLLALTLNTSCKENGYDSAKTPEAEHSSTAEKDESPDRAQGGAHASREKVIGYLQKLYLIEDPMNYEVKLTNLDLHIDGRKQPDTIHRHIMENFVRNPDRRLEVTYLVKTD